MPKVETLGMLLRSGQYERAACRLVYGLVKVTANQMELEKKGLRAPGRGKGEGREGEIAASPAAPRKDKRGVRATRLPRHFVPRNDKEVQGLAVTKKGGRGDEIATSPAAPRKDRGGDAPRNDRGG